MHKIGPLSLTSTSNFGDLTTRSYLHSLNHLIYKDLTLHLSPDVVSLSVVTLKERKDKIAISLISRQHIMCIIEFFSSRLCCANLLFFQHAHEFFCTQLQETPKVYWSSNVFNSSFSTSVLGSDVINYCMTVLNSLIWLHSVLFFTSFFISFTSSLLSSSDNCTCSYSESLPKSLKET